MKKIIIIIMITSFLCFSDQLIGKAIPHTEYGSAIIDIRDHDNSSDFLIAGWDMTAYHKPYFAKINKWGDVISENRNFELDFHIDDIIYSKNKGYIFNSWDDIYVLNKDLEISQGPFNVGPYDRIYKIFEDNNGDFLLGTFHCLKKCDENFTLDLNFANNGILQFNNNNGYVLDIFQTNNESYIALMGAFPGAQGISYDLQSTIIKISNDGKDFIELKPQEQFNFPGFKTFKGMSSISHYNIGNGEYLITGAIRYHDVNDIECKGAYLMKIDQNLSVLNMNVFPNLEGGICVSKYNEKMILVGRDLYFGNNTFRYDFAAIIIDKDFNYIDNSFKKFPGDQSEGTCWEFGAKSVGNGEIVFVTNTTSTNIGGDYSKFTQKNLYYGYYKYAYTDSEIQLLLLNW